MIQLFAHHPEVAIAKLMLGHSPHANTCSGVHYHYLRHRLDGQQFLVAAGHDVWVQLSPYNEQVLNPA